MGLIQGTDPIYLFDSHSKDKSGNLSSSGTAAQVWSVAYTGKLCTFSLLQNLTSYNLFFKKHKAYKHT